MNIIALVKQVPSTESLMEIDADGSSIKTEDVKWVINPYDEFALEEALRIKEKLGEGKVTAVSVGPDRIVSALRTALAMGADEAVLINDPAVSDIDASGIATVLAAAINDIPRDLILAGVRAVDDDLYQVPAALAERLNMAQITGVNKVEFGDGKIICRQIIDGGTRVVSADLPALVTTEKGINEPRYASLPNIMKAKRKPLETRNLADIGLDPAAVSGDEVKCKTVSLSLPPDRGSGKMLTGETPEKIASELVHLLKTEAEML